MRYSVIIPTYNKCKETLKPCLESIVKYTTLNSPLDYCEIIVVANGCTDETANVVKEFQQKFHNIRMLWNEEPMGFTRATNWGIKEAKGEYIILLNNDTQLLHQSPNQWLEMLVAPFEQDLKTGITGPMKTFCHAAGREFIIFFCVMIPRRIFDEIGTLDECFSPGYGEDSDLSCRIEDAGYKIVQVPYVSDQYYDNKRMTGGFPIYHEGNVTFKNWPGGEELLRRNNETLRTRYNKPRVDISKAEQCDGFMSSTELKWLAENAKNKEVIIEIGSWHGRSTRALADNTEGTIYAIDHWLGSEVERTTNHASAALNEGDHAFMEFCDNLKDHILTGRVRPIRMSSKNAARVLKDSGTQADMIFIDAGHTKEEVLEDISLWLPLVKEGGVICGHDYYHNGEHWPGVQQAVDEVFGQRGKDMGWLPDNSIWRHTKEKEESKPRIYDCFPFFNELDILEVRFNELYDVVDRFVIVEATLTHGGKPKPLYFNENLPRFEKFLHKVTHIVVSDYPALDSWSIERHQRDQIMRGLTQCNDNDIIIIGDADEIPRATCLKEYKPENGIMALQQRLYYYSLDCQSDGDLWDWCKMVTYGELKTKSPCEVRYTPFTNRQNLIPNAGWHFSYITNIDGIIEKIGASAHQEYNKPEWKDKERVTRLVEEGKDLFDRPLGYVFVEIDSTYPEFIQKNYNTFLEKGLISEKVLCTSQ